MALKRRNYRPDATGSLTGMRVIDLSRLVCGNTLTMLLGDFGADVVKIEPPDGDTLRDWRALGVEAHWKVLGRNKKSLCIDLRKQPSLEILRQLTAQASVFVESFRPGTLEKMGLGPDVLLGINPALVIVRISGWGQTGPYRERPGFGTLVEAMSGLAMMTGFPDREPLLPPNAMADAVAGFAGAMATLAALRHVEVNGGKGQVVDLPLFDPLFSILGPNALQYRISGKVRPRTGSRSTNASPRNVYRTSDGKWIALSASIQAMTERLFRSIGRPELIDDPRFRTNTDRLANVVELDRIIGEFIGGMTQAEAVEYFDKADVTIGPIYDISQIIEDPHFQDRETVVEVPDDEIGFIPVQGITPTLSATPGEFRHPAPRLGQNNDEILGLIGMTPEEIQALRVAGVVHGGDEIAQHERGRRKSAAALTPAP